MSAPPAPQPPLEPISQSRLFWRGILPAQAYIGFLFFLGLAVLYFDQPAYNYVQASGYNYVIPEAGTSSLGQAITTGVFLAGTIGFAFLLARMVKNHRQRIPSAIAVLMGVSVYGTISNNFFYFIPTANLYMITLISFILYLLVAMGKAKRAFALPFITLISIGFALTILIFFPGWTPLILPAALAVWDLYAVFKGPLGRFVSAASPNMINLLTARVGDTSIGLGDLVVYTLLVTFAQARFGNFWVVGGVGVSILVGLGITLYLLRTHKLRAIPALPIPVALTMIPLGLALIL